MSVVIIRKRSQAGQSILLAVVAMGLVMAGGLGFAIDTAQLYLHRQMAQAAADAAATAGIMSLFQGVNVVGATGYFDPSATFTCGVNNAKIPCKYASYHGFGTSADDTITVSFPTTASGYSGTLSSDSPNQIKIVISRQVHNNFIRFFGAAATTSIKATATAAIVEVVSPTPIIVTHPTAANALSGNGNTSITICGGPSRSIQVNSSNPNAVSISTIDLSHAGPDDSGGCTTGTGADMGVFGGPSSKPGSLNLGSKGHYVQPASPILDPLAFVNPPAVPAVDPAKVTIHS
ncbi:MAG TPA: pilus assembly protein TadG-related protein, partial [Bryobacteraceae bacterium]